MNIANLTSRAEAGGCAAQTTLGMYYLHGNNSVAVDYEKALHFLSMAAEQGASRAIANLGDVYLKGLGTPRDLSKAVKLYEQVAHVEFFAALELGRIYANGGELPVDTQRAVDWYTVAISFAEKDFDHEALGQELREAKAYVERHRDGALGAIGPF